MGGTMQVMIRCCNDDLEVDNDDDEKPQMTKVKQQPTMTRDKKDDLISSESFNTTIPCFSNN